MRRRAKVKTVDRPKGSLPLWEVSFREVDGRGAGPEVTYKPERILLVYAKTKDRATKRAIDSMGPGRYVVLGNTTQGARCKLVGDGYVKPNAAQK